MQIERILAEIGRMYLEHLDDQDTIRELRQALSQPAPGAAPTVALSTPQETQDTGSREAEGMIDP